MTTRQTELLEFLQQYRERNGISPSTREMQQHFGFRSQTAIMRHLQALVAQGLVRKTPGRARTWRPAEDANRLPAPGIKVPLYGSIPAGWPEDPAESGVEYIHLDSQALSLPTGARMFALRVRGDSMILAHILPGDLVIMEFRTPKHGEIVAALIDGETTLKRFLIKDKKPFLRAENPEYPDLVPARELVIQGVLICLVRKCSAANKDASMQKNAVPSL